MTSAPIVEFLKSKKFYQNAKGDEFTHSYTENSLTIDLKIKFNEAFPFQLPDIIISNYDDLPFIPHVERNGKICLFQKDACIWDYNSEHEIINELIGKAKKTFEKGISDHSANELISEFPSYWNQSNAHFFRGTPYSLINVDEKARGVFLFEMNKELNNSKWIIADDIKSALEFSNRFDSKLHHFHQEALYLPLNHNFPPPDFRKVLEVKEIFKRINESSKIENKNFFNKFLKENKLPLLVALSMPFDESRILFALYLLKSNNQKNVQKGFRPNKIFASHELNFIQDDPCEKINFKRFDKDYLLKRTGARNCMNDKKALIIGCGSVGGYVAEYLASTGIGNIAIIDKDCLNNENLYRHCLGIQYYGQKKVEALKRYLELKYKDLNIDAHDLDAHTDINEKILNVDIVIILTGDENLNRVLNKKISKDTPLLFGWLEPLGIGTHVVSSNINKTKGCLECLYLSNQGEFQSNRAMFCKSGQDVRKGYAGCSGSFLPYSSLDAVRLALKIAYCSIDILNKKVEQNFLKSTLGDTQPFLSEGLKLEKRYRTFKEGETKIENNFFSKFCKECVKKQ